MKDYKEGDYITYKVRYPGMQNEMYASGEVISVKQEMVMGRMENVYLVSEGNGAQNMTYVPESEILTLLNG